MPGAARRGMRTHEGESYYSALRGWFAAHKTSVFGDIK